MPPLYCPTCAEPLTVSQCADPRATCLACSRGHHYFINPEPPLTEQTSSAAAAKFPALVGTSGEGVTSFWLSDPRARSVLNEQLAALLRTIADARFSETETPFLYCPMCAQPLTQYDQPDAWVLGLHCSHAHLWALRGGRLVGVGTDSKIVLCAEFAKRATVQLMTAWLNDNPHLAPQLHESVALVLKRWLAGGA